MQVTSTVDELTPAAIRRALAGFPHAEGYGLHVIPLRYRGDKPHLSAWTDFEEKTITIQIPEPFLAFGEVIPFGAQRRPGKGMRFIWLTEGITLRTPREVLRFLYLHGTEAVLAERMNAREGHFMPPALLATQLATLDDPRGEPGVATVEIGASLDEVIATAIATAGSLVEAR